MIWLRIGIIAALLAGAWALHHQIGVSGELREQLKQRQQQIDKGLAEIAAANAQVLAIESENSRQNELIVRVTNERNRAREAERKVRDDLRSVVTASADPCVTASVPDDVARAAGVALDELWQPRAAAGARGQGDAAAGAAARLPAP